MPSKIEKHLNVKFFEEKCLILLQFLIISTNLMGYYIHVQGPLLKTMVFIDYQLI